MRDPYHHLSPSGYSTWRTCPRQWRAKYVDMAPVFAPRPALVGKYVHRIAERFFRDHRPEQRTVECMRGIARGDWLAWLDDDCNDIERGIISEDELAFKQDVWRLASGLFTVCDPSTLQVEEVEHKFSLRLAGVPFLGYADLVANGVLVDYKSAATAEIFQSKVWPQLKLYVACWRAEGRDVKFAEAWWLSDRTRLRVPIHERAVKTVVDDFAAAWAEIQDARTTRAYEEIPGPLCAWCPALGECQSGQVEVHRRISEGKIREDAPAWSVLDLTPAT